MDSPAGTQNRSAVFPAAPPTDQANFLTPKLSILILFGLWLVIYAGTMFTPRCSTMWTRFTPKQRAR